MRDPDTSRDAALFLQLKSFTASAVEYGCVYAMSYGYEFNAFSAFKMENSQSFILH